MIVVHLYFKPLPGESKGKMLALDMEPEEGDRLRRDFLNFMQRGEPTAGEYQHSEGRLVVNLGYIHFVK